MSDRWTKLPAPSSRWDALEYDSRALGTQLYLAYGEGELDLGPDWRLAVARRLAVSGRARPRLYRDLDAIIEAGLIVVGGTTVELFYARKPSASQRPVTRQSPRREPTVNEQSSNSESTVTAPSLSGQQHPTPRKHSTPTPIEEREKEERETRARAPDPEPPPGMDARGQQQIRRDLRDAVRVAYERQFFVATTVSPSWSPGANTALDTIAQWLVTSADLRKCQPESLISPLLRGFFGNARVGEKRWPITWLANNPAEYLGGSAGVTNAPPADPETAADNARGIEIRRLLDEVPEQAERDALDAELQALGDRARARLRAARNGKAN
jgi:hypothetical protein